MSDPSSWTAHRLTELSQTECRRLLSTKSVGRVAFAGEGAAPIVLPVNYVSRDGVIYFRTASHNVLGTHLKDAMASFQVDDIDDFLESGWSVLVQGQSDFVDPSDEADLGLDRPSRQPDPWASGVRNLLVRITPFEISGRRINPR
ncbi:MAG TPA: pyridoxamine 5'-phosphate oxidase family protein [Nocardioidaceae bacterium]|jgi:nitroimidazol reductase NimA-like FMN-containing flavoprotein (pyridoxamine 5'-phosphate oxidase superfamily)